MWRESATMKAVVLASLVIGNAVLAVESMLAQDQTFQGGWASFGIAGLVLAWLLLVYMPAKDRRDQANGEAKDKQMKELLDRFDSERNQDRTDRHSRYSEYQASINKQFIAYEENLRRQNDQHKMDAENDRKAFLERQERTESALGKAIALQTHELKILIGELLKNVCNFNGTCQNYQPRQPEKSNG